MEKQVATEFAKVAKTMTKEEKLGRYVSSHLFAHLSICYLDELLDEESYQAAKADLVVEKAVLKQEKSRLQKTGVSRWIEPAKDAINALESAGKIQRSKSVNETSSLVQKIGTNRLIARKKVSFDFSPPYDFASQFLAETRARSKSSPGDQLGREGTRTNWCPGPDLNRHALRQRLLRPSCLPFHHPGA